MGKQSGYKTPNFKNEITLKLSSNESCPAMDDLDACLSSLDHNFVSLYPSHLALQELLGGYLELDHERLVISAGGDDSIDRIFRLLLSPSKPKVVTHAPSFEMFNIYCGNYGGKIESTKWLAGDFPTDGLIGLIDESTALVIVTSPNNPTGGWIGLDDIQRVNEAAKSVGAKLLVDNAYIEFADEDLTQQLASDENILIIRTFSKAWGLAGLRVGYLIAPTAEFATEIRNASGPFPVSAVSLEVARRSLENYQSQMEANVARIKQLRDLTARLIADCGGQPFPSQGNFILAEFPDTNTIWEGLAEDGIGIRKYVDKPFLENRTRITIPPTADGFLKLAHSLCRVTGSDFEPHKNALGQLLKPENVASESTEQIPFTESEVAAGDRTYSHLRETKETKIEIELNLDGTGKTDIKTGIGFLDHMLTALAFHSRLDLKLHCDGDLYVDDHHTAEDCALALGTAIDQALGKRTGIKRFGYAYAPLDEAMARTVIDLSGRPWPEIHLQLEREMVGEWACENIVHFFQSFAMTLKCSLHVDVLRGTNDHHRAEAAFKSCAKALREALTRTDGEVPSTKGVL